MSTTTIQVPEDVSSRLGDLASSKGEAVQRLLTITESQNTRTMPFNQTVKPGSKATFYDEARVSGTLRAISIQWPPGASFLVGVKVSYQNTAILPQSGFLYKDDYKQPYRLEQKVERGDKIFIEIANRDDTHEHQITAELIMVGVR